MVHDPPVPIETCSRTLGGSLRTIDVVYKNASESALTLVGPGDEDEHESARLPGAVFLYERFNHFAASLRQLAGGIFQEVR